MSVQYSIIGGKNFEGEIQISGAKNFSIKALVASLLAEGKSEFYNVPNNQDVDKTLKMLKSIGADYEFDVNNKKCTVTAINLKNNLEDSENVNMTTFLIAAALLKRFNSVSFPQSRGCGLGDRLNDFYIDAFNKFGASCTYKNGAYFLTRDKELKACNFYLPYPSVGASEVSIFLAVIANGESILENIAIEPEVQALITLLVEMGAKIIFEGDRKLRIIGTQTLSPVIYGYIHGDYIEIATWAALSLISDGKILVQGVMPELIGSFLSLYSMLGGGFTRKSNDSMWFYKDTSSINQNIGMLLKNLEENEIQSNINIETGVFPMIRTDLQPILAVMAATQDGIKTTIHETVYNNRLDYIEDFNSFGANLKGFKSCLGKECKYASNYLHSVIINGKKDFKAVRSIKAKTVRSGMANVLMATIAKGETKITSMETVERGYCTLYQKLLSLNVSVNRIEV